MTIMGDNAAEDAEITEALVDVEIISNSNNRYDNQECGPGCGQGQCDFSYSRGRGHNNSYRGRGRQWDGNDSNNRDRDNRDRNSESQGNSNRVEDGIIIVEVKDIVIVEEGDDGIPISSIMIQGINRSPHFKIQITTDHPRWDINIDTQPHMVCIHTPSNNNNTLHKCQRLLNKPLIFVNCVTVKAIMITNANLQATLWHARKKPLIKVDHTVTKTLIMGNGHKAKLITMTQMGNLFSSGGS